jgi:hypothetical protein
VIILFETFDVTVSLSYGQISPQAKNEGESYVTWKIRRERESDRERERERERAREAETREEGREERMFFHTITDRATKC